MNPPTETSPAGAPPTAVDLLAQGRALAKAGDAAAAQALLRQAVALKPDYAEAWMALAIQAGARWDLADAVLDEALAANPDDTRLMEGKVLVLRAAGQGPRALAFLQTVVTRFETLAWAHLHLGDLLAETDRMRAIAHLRRAFQIQPSADHATLLAQALEWVTGEAEGASRDEAYGLARGVLAASGPQLERLNPGHLKVLCEVFAGVCAFDDLAAMGDFATLGRAWAGSGRQVALLRQMPRVTSLADRLELVAQHRLWGRGVEAQAAAAPIRRGPRRTPDGRIRLGLLSSDLRRHPVGYFAAPLFDHPDPARFDLYLYSAHPGAEDDLQRHFAAQAAAMRWMPGASPRDLAQAIADDDLDMLIEIGGMTTSNRGDALAWRPAPIQASWLGYPHSLGLEAVDWTICDAETAPADARLMLEQPLVLPRPWIALGQAVFDDRHAIEAALPEDRAGALTFGTANNPYKFTRETLRTWARVTAAVPGARFAFIRPEAASAVFRGNVLAEFAAEGVAPERVDFHPVRGLHMPLYNSVDISLDTLPLTGGTTTAEALWMGVPVVSLRGPAFYERISASILIHAGLGDLVADDLAGFERIARELAADRRRRTALRAGLRAQLRQGPLGRTEDFARAFYDAVARTVAAGPR
jgi:protein O-GlcNAc transferase